MSDLLKKPAVAAVAEPVKTSKTRAALKFTAITIFTLVMVCLLIVTIAFAAKKAYAERILHNVTIGTINVSAMSQATASAAVQKQFNTMIDQGLTVGLFDKTAVIDLAPTGSTDPDLVYPLLDLNVNDLVDQAYAVGRTGNPLIDFFTPLYYVTFGQDHLTPNINIAETKLTEAIRAAYPDAESPGTPTDFAILKSDADWNIAVTPAVTGSTIDLNTAFETIKTDADTDLKLSPLRLELIERSAIISQADAETLIPEVKIALDNGPYSLTFTTESKTPLSFPVTIENLQTWLQPGVSEGGLPMLTLDTASMQSFLADIHAKIDVAAKDAIFVTDGDRVTTFTPSADGVRIDDDALVASLVSAFETGTKDVALTVGRTNPSITTAASNALGINELLGTGTSNYGSSSSNRIANIKHGAAKLNGILIKPGETLSLLDQLKPFTMADGYFPELVIKGDQIKPEVGGGLCQIGTTTFRAVMNSGLKVVERRNHSLVISHYNDPSNGNPGTDATIYDPSPDFKFENDTTNTILFIANVDTKTHDLTFSFWGTSDGRKGYYDPPKVLSWSSASKEIKYIQTSDLAPGKESCEPSFPGATTTFDYHIDNPDGTSTVQTFDSTYRALQRVCLQGIDPNAPPPAVEGETTTIPADASADVVVQ